MNLAARILKWARWTVRITVPDYPRCIICVAPHTSNLDFVMGKLAYASVGRHAGFLMKKDWFFWPLGPIFRAMGGIPVDRSKRPDKKSLTEQVVSLFKSRDHMVLAITPEGTRSATTQWHTGFLTIAREAVVPIVLGAIDYKERLIVIEREFTPTGNTEADMRAVKAYYRDFTGKHPEKFTAE